ncbi:MAG: hypothetical protein ACI4OC_02305, partial [Coriobacteriales bacterium]
MKISSVSKKVLCGALSAAMVVAFAPTVAFGATGDKATATYKMGAGAQAQAGAQALAATGEMTETAKVFFSKTDSTGAAAVYKIADADYAAAQGYAANGYKFKGFFLDLDKDGVKDSDEPVAVQGDAESTAPTSSWAADGWYFNTNKISANKSYDVVAEYAVATAKADLSTSVCGQAFGNAS